MTIDAGKFITLEGGEGAGKTTNIPFIKNILAEQGIDVVVTREPGGTPLAESIRGLLLHDETEQMSFQTELLMVFAARSQHIKRVIRPALAKGCWVISDRFTDATYAYQGGGRNLPESAIAWLENFVQEDLRPDMTLLFDLPVETGLLRAKNRGGQRDRFESEELDFFGKVRDRYLAQAQAFPNRIKIIAADRPLLDVQEGIRNHILSLLR